MKETVDVLLTILGIVSLILAIMGTYFGLKAKRSESKIMTMKEQAEAAEQKRKKEQVEIEQVRDEKINNQFEKQLKFLRSETESMVSLLNDMTAKQDKTNDTVEQLRTDFNEHKIESSIIKDFNQVYRYAYNQAIDSWVTDEFNEKYKQLLILWSNSFKQYCLDYLDYKMNKIGLFNEYEPESIMFSLIDNFRGLCGSFSTEIIGKVDLGQWLIDKDKIHAKSEFIALEFKRNGMTTKELNDKIGNYIVNFSKVYIRAIGKWIQLNAKKTQNG